MQRRIYNKGIFFVGFAPIFSENKTGVGICQECLLKGLHNCGVRFYVAVNRRNIKMKKYVAKNPWLKEHLSYEKDLSYEKEIQWAKFFGKRPIELVHGYRPICFVAHPAYYHIFPCKQIVWIHDMMTMRYPEYYTKENLKNHAMLFRSAKKAQAVFVVSHTTKEDVVRYLHIPPDRIRVIYNGIDNRFFEGKVDDVQSNIDFSKKYYIYIGSMRKNKNLINAIKGFEIYLTESKQDVYFYIAGGKSYDYSILKGYVDSRSSLKDKVLFLGYVSEEEKVLLYRQAKGLLFVSEYEGFGIPIIEAFASRIPVVTSNCSSMKEIGEGHAVLVDPFSPKGIAEGLQMAENCKKDVIEKNYQYAKQFTWRRVAEKYYKAILKV